MLDAHPAIFCLRVLGLFPSFRFVVEFRIFVDWSHSNIPHTRHDARRSPHDLLFLSFPGTSFPGTFFRRPIFRGLFFRGPFFSGTTFPGTIFPGDHFSRDNFSGIQTFFMCVWTSVLFTWFVGDLSLNVSFCFRGTFKCNKYYTAILRLYYKKCCTKSDCIVISLCYYDAILFFWSYCRIMLFFIIFPLLLLFTCII